MKTHFFKKKNECGAIDDTSINLADPTQLTEDPTLNDHGVIYTVKVAINNGSATEQNNNLFFDFEINDKLEANSDQYIPVKFKFNASLKALLTGTTYKNKLIEVKDRELMKITL